MRQRAEQAATVIAAEPHEHTWQLVYVDYDDAIVPREMACHCGQVTYRSY